MKLIFCFLTILAIGLAEINESATTVLESVTTSTTPSTELSGSTVTSIANTTIEGNETAITTTPLPKDDFNATKEVKKPQPKSRGHLNTSDYTCECDTTVSFSEKFPHFKHKTL